MSQIAARTFTQAFDAVRSLLNDTGGEIYTDAMLLEKGVQIHGQLQDAFSLERVEFGEGFSATITYTAATTTVPTSSLTDILMPIEVWERTDATDAWHVMERVNELPEPAVTSPGTLRYWEWSEDILKVNPASANRQIRIRYLKQWTFQPTAAQYPTAASQMGPEGFYWPFVYGTAWLGALATGRSDLATAYQAQYDRRSQESVARAKTIQEATLRGPAPDRATVSWLDAARMLLKDTARLRFQDAFLLEMAAQIHAELQEEFSSAGLQFGEATATLAAGYTANAITISLASLTDLYEPLDLWERRNSSESWQDMVKVDELPAPPLTAPDTLQHWEWSEFTLKVNPASVQRDIRLRYQRQLAYPTATTPTRFQPFYWALAFGVAAACAAISSDEELKALAQNYQGRYEQRKHDAVNREVQFQQGVRRGPQPYRGLTQQYQ